MRGGAKSRESGSGGGIGFARNEEEFRVSGCTEPSAELDPAGEGPVFLGRAAAGVNGDQAGGGGRVGEVEPSCVRAQAERAERRAIVGGGGSEGRKRGAGQEYLVGTDGKMRCKIVLGVGPEIEHEVEARECVGENRRKRRRRVESSPTRFVLRVDAVQQAGVEAEDGGGGVANEFDVRGRPALAKERESGKRDDEIAEGTASKDEDFFHPAARRNAGRIWLRRPAARSE